MKILILNWRDIKNPKSGGAEILTHEIAKRWVKKGHEVVIFSSEFEGGAREEVIDNVQIIRRGRPDARFLFSSVHFLSFINYENKFKGKFDVIVDEVHGLPFFTPWFVKEKKVVLICEVARELWTEMFGSFFGSLGRLVERFYLSFVYKNIQFMTISDSSKKDLLEEGVRKENITVLPMGINVPRLTKYKKESDPTLIFVGRISKSKGIEDTILVLSEVSKNLSKVKLWVVGRGDRDYIDYLKNVAKENHVEDKISWFGFISEDKKFELLGKAHFLISPSIKEGWGLTIPEAAYVGTPSIVYNSPGLRDVLKGSKFKIMVSYNDPTTISNEVVRIFKDRELYNQIVNQKVIRGDYSWDRTADVALRVLENA